MNKYLFLFWFFLTSVFHAGIATANTPLSSIYTVDTKWATAYQVTVQLTNQSNSPTDSWLASFSLPQGNILSSYVSGGNFSVSGQNVTVQNLSTNGAIAGNGSVTFNMIIDMPQGGPTTINNLVASANGTTPVPSLPAPVLNPITSTSTTDYSISWNNVTGAAAYYLQADTTNNFTNPQIVYQGSSPFFNISNQPSGTYFYRVAAENSTSMSPYSNTESITVPNTGTTIALNAFYTVDTIWATAFHAVVTLTNSTTASVNGWEATFTLPAGMILTDHVNSGIFNTNGQNVTVTNLSSNNIISPNGSVTFDMIIDKSSQAQPQINNLQATGNVSSNPLPPTVPAAPVATLQSTSENSFNVSWNSVASATSYTLQEDISSSFTNPTNVTQGNVLSYAFSNKPAGTYYYRVFATNSAGNSAYSNTVSITVSNVTPIPLGIEYSAWYIDWTSWFTGPTFVIPSGVNMLNIFVGELTTDSNGNPTMGGFGTFTQAQMQEFVQYLAQQNPPIKAKVSIGGGGGSYDNTWNILTSGNINAFAQGMVDFCHTIGLAGVDFDYESFVSPAQEALVGQLIKAFKLLDPNLQTSLCSNAGFGSNFPWEQDIKNILDAAMIGPGNCAVDRFYIMSYYNSMDEEEGWIVGPDGNGGWANWLITNYGFNRSRISVGIDDFDAHAYDPIAFRSWAISQGFSVAHWAFDPAHPN